MRRLSIVLALLALAACDQPGADADYSGERQQPSTTQPGVSISGSATIGLVKRIN